MSWYLVLVFRIYLRLWSILEMAMSTSNLPLLFYPINLNLTSPHCNQPVAFKLDNQITPMSEKFLCTHILSN